MSNEYAPQAIRDLFNAIQKLIPSALLGGIQGDAAHVYGYHRARNVLPGGDYSVVEAADKLGDGWACSALDVTLGANDLMHTVSQRLLDAKNDPRMAPIREFFGTVDGRTVCGWDWSHGGPTTSDDMTHLWHVHLSIHRKYANDAKALAGVADVLAGVPAVKEYDMASFTEAQLRAIIADEVGKANGKSQGWVRQSIGDAFGAYVTRRGHGYFNRKNVPDMFPAPVEPARKP